MKSLTDLELFYKSLLEDKDFENLEFQLKKPNIFSILGIENYELKHSRFLSWLLNPRANHNLGSTFLNKLLRELLIDNRINDLSIIELPELELDKAVIHVEWKNIDILVELPKVVIAIENKIKTIEHSNQLFRYKKTIEESFINKTKLFVYLTPFGLESTMNDTYVNLSYNTIVNILSELVEKQNLNINPAIKKYIEDYIEAIKVNVMETSDINELSRRIYLHHQELFDLVIANKPDDASEFRVLLENKIKLKGWMLGSPNKGYVRFLTPALNEIIPKGYANGWTNKESFLFEICFLYTGKNQIRIFATIDASDKESACILKPILDTIEGKENKSQQWMTYKNVYHKGDFTKILRNVPDEAREFTLDAIMKLAEGIVNEIEPSILEKKDELVKLKESRNH